jgi:hypothetical protein
MASGAVEFPAQIISDTPAHDLAGLALKASATATTWLSLWEHTREDLDHEETAASRSD